MKAKDRPNSCARLDGRKIETFGSYVVAASASRD
jgi:hypothetical protein